MNNKRLRVIILNYNRASLTLACVDSVLKQSYCDSIDIVVVDNYSSKTDFDVLARGLPSAVIIIRCSHNLGYAAGNNVGARLGQLPLPDYYLVINNDVLLVDPYTCEKLVNALEQDQISAACSPLVDSFGTNLSPLEQIQVRRIPTFGTLLITSSWWLRRLPILRGLAGLHTYDDCRPFSADTKIQCETINGSCFVIRGEVWRRLGFFDEATFLYTEELILGKQIQDIGMHATLVTSVIIRHEQGATTGQHGGRINLRLAREMVRSELYFCRCYLHTPPLALGLLCWIRFIDICSKLILQRLPKRIAHLQLGLLEPSRSQRDRLSQDIDHDAAPTHSTIERC